MHIKYKYLIKWVNKILYDFLTRLVLNGKVLEILKYKPRGRIGAEIDRTLHQTGLHWDWLWIIQRWLPIVCSLSLIGTDMLDISLSTVVSILHNILYQKNKMSQLSAFLIFYGRDLNLLRVWRDKDLLTEWEVSQELRQRHEGKWEEKNVDKI